MHGLLTFIVRFLAWPLHRLALWVARSLVMRGDPIHGYLSLSRLLTGWRLNRNESALRFEPKMLRMLKELWAKMPDEARAAVPDMLKWPQVQRRPSIFDGMDPPPPPSYLKVELTKGVHAGLLVVTSPSKVFNNEVDTLETVACACGLLVDCDAVEAEGGCPACGSRISIHRNINA